jgi:hypothetical protein
VSATQQPPTKQDDRPQAPPAPGPGAGRPGGQANDRAVDADILLDVPKLSVEELNLELEAAFLLRRVKLEAKGLDAGLYLKSNLDNIAAMTSGRSSEDDADGKGHGASAARVRGSLRELLGSTRDTAHKMQNQLGAVHESAGEAYERVVGGGGDGEDDAGDDGAGALGERATRAARRGGKALGLTAAGVAGGALLESALKPSRRLRLPRRRNRAHALVHELQRRLP